MIRPLIILIFLMMTNIAHAGMDFSMISNRDQYFRSLEEALIYGAQANEFQVAYLRRKLRSLEDRIIKIKNRMPYELDDQDEEDRMSHQAYYYQQAVLASVVHINDDRGLPIIPNRSYAVVYGARIKRDGYKKALLKQHLDENPFYPKVLEVAEAAMNGAQMYASSAPVKVEE